MFDNKSIIAEKKQEHLMIQEKCEKEIEEKYNDNVCKLKSLIEKNIIPFRELRDVANKTCNHESFMRCICVLEKRGINVLSWKDNGPTIDSCSDPRSECHTMYEFGCLIVGNGKKWVFLAKYMDDTDCIGGILGLHTGLFIESDREIIEMNVYCDLFDGNTSAEESTMVLEMMRSGKLMEQYYHDKWKYIKHLPTLFQNIGGEDWAGCAKNFNFLKKFGHNNPPIIMLHPKNNDKKVIYIHPVIEIDGIWKEILPEEKIFDKPIKVGLLISKKNQSWKGEGILVEYSGVKDFDTVWKQVLKFWNENQKLLKPHKKGTSGFKLTTPENWKTNNGKIVSRYAKWINHHIKKVTNSRLNKGKQYLGFIRAGEANDRLKDCLALRIQFAKYDSSWKPRTCSAFINATGPRNEEYEFVFEENKLQITRFVIGEKQIESRSSIFDREQILEKNMLEFQEKNFKDVFENFQKIMESLFQDYEIDDGLQASKLFCLPNYPKLPKVKEWDINW